MPVTLNATQVPAPLTFSGVYDPVASGPITGTPFAQGALLSALDLNTFAGRSDLLGRYGTGAYGIATGLAISAGSGLTLNIAAGAAQSDGPVRYSGGSIVLTASVSRVWIWLSQAGAVVQVNNSLTPPAGAHVLLGSAVTGVSTITSVDTSGVVYLSPVPWRETADPGPSVPGDGAGLPTTVMFLHFGANDTWLWDGPHSTYRNFSSGSSGVVAVADGGTGATTAPGARQNLGAAPYGVYNVPVSTDATLTAPSLNGASFILFSDTGVSTDFTATFPNTGLQAGQPWGVRNNTGEGMEMKVSGGSESVYLETGQYCTIAYDGAELREVGKPSFGYLNNVEQVVTDPTTYANWREVEANLTQLIPSGSPVTVNYPTAGALNVKGRIFAIRNDHATGILNVRTNGSSGDHSNNWFLPEEYQLFVIAADGAMHRLPTRPYTKRAVALMPSDANYTLVDPTPLAWLIEVTSTGALTATRDIIIPTLTDHEWRFANLTTGAQAIRVKTSGGAGVTIANGSVALVSCNGTDIRRLTGDVVY